MMPGLAGLRRHPVLLAAPAVPALLERLEVFFEVETADDLPGGRALRRRLEGKSALIAATPAGIDAALLEGLPHLRAVCRIGAGSAGIDLEACTRAGVIATDTPGLGEDAAAWHAMALIAADNLIAAFGFGRIGGRPPNLLNTELRCTLGCCL
jgi:lactate dehydrogenase-like 2-hydroxyacid dehydrogenase